MSAPKEILDLVRRFEQNADAYKSSRYNEAQLRQEFVNPFFKCLGWDIDNTRGASEKYKDVIHEAAIKIGGATKAPDYCFRFGGNPIFFLEAKKPAVNIKDDPAPAYQLRRYAWTAQLPLSVLTDFEEFAVYDTRVRPANTDKASAARIRYYAYKEYPDRWEDISAIFSTEAVDNGSFDKYAEAKKGKRGTATVDVAFLETIESWRDMLAKNLALRNPKLTQRELNYAVQVTIDRIIFLRMCEDRGIETDWQLQGLQNGPGIYGRLKQLFVKADERYNSGLFYFHKEPERAEPPDELTPALKIDDRPLQEIIQGLYYPESPYDFRVLPVEILGQVYEQFLGKVIRLTAGHQARVEDKPEVKKAGGVYYTPRYIVDYIVQHTVGQLLPSPMMGEGQSGDEKPSPTPHPNPLPQGGRGSMTPKQATKLRILDPACGSGSFLLGAYQYLLDWHRDWYVADGTKKHTKEIYQGPGGIWRLTTAEKKRILLNNIYGVDIDPQAVEVTKLSLLLKVLEGESKESLDSQLRFFHERALPDLASNIKCGNSLIGPDFYDGQQLIMFDDEERYRINVFDWNAAFPKIMKAGGFDAVIGNPPWGQKEIDGDDKVKRYTWEYYPSSKGIYDLFRPFVERGIRLTEKSGMFGMVLPDIVLLKDYQETRRLLLQELTLEAIDWWGMAFSSAVIDATTIIGMKGPASTSNQVRVGIRDPESPLAHLIPQADFSTNPRLVFNLFLTAEKRKILDGLADCPKLGQFFEIHEGVHSGNVRDELFVKRKVDKSCQPLLFGRDEIVPYLLRWNGSYIRLAAMPERKTPERYANLGKPEWHKREKVLVRRTGDHVLAAVDRRGRYASNNFFLVFPKCDSSLELDGLCAILNSYFMTWYFRTIEPRKGRVFAELKIKHLETFPLPPVILENKGCQELNELGVKRAGLAAELMQAMTPKEVVVLQRSAKFLDEKIEQLVRQSLAVPKDFVANEATDKELTDGERRKDFDSGKTLPHRGTP
jgi:type I restriction-modification system DNA methylase subunit